MLIHDEIPPGMPTMQRLKAKITYKFEDSERGGRVLITTQDPEALNAIHEFLRFQIKDTRRAIHWKSQNRFHELSS